jgi:deoxyribodipyrimidine photo-lyase
MVTSDSLPSYPSPTSEVLFKSDYEFPKRQMLGFTGFANFPTHFSDYELASNNGNWQWAAGCGCDAAPYFRVFNPTIQQAKFDPNFEYIKLWVPEFGTFDYPKPMVDHKQARERAISFYKGQLAIQV